MFRAVFYLAIFLLTFLLGRGIPHLRLKQRLPLPPASCADNNPDFAGEAT